MIKRSLQRIKNNRRIQIVLVLLLILILFQIYHWYSSYSAQQAMKQDTLTYLQNERAYDIDADIAEIKVYLASMKERRYMSAVVFADERDAIYFYAYKPKSKTIRQIDAERIGEESKKTSFKHEETE